jgi:hypothetical protein
MKTRWKILIIVGIFAVLSGAVSLVTMRIQPGNEVEAYKNSLREKGEKLEISEIVPPPVPMSENCADAVQMAFAAFSSGGYKTPNAMQMVAPGKALAAWKQPDVRGYDGSSGKDMTNSWDEFAADVAIHRPAIELLKEVFSRPKLDFAPDYKKGAYMLLPQLAPFKRTAQVLSAAAICDLHNGDTGAAATNICVLLALVRADHDEPIIISHLVRIAMVAIAESPSWELLQATNVTDAQLALLQKNWELTEFLDSTEKACEMERALMKDDVEKARADGAEFDRMMGSFSGSSPSSGGSSWSWPPDLDQLGDSLKYASGKILWRTSWSFTEERHFLQADQIVLETLRTMETNRQFLKPQYDAMQGKLASLGLTNAGAVFFRALKIPDFGDMLGGNWMGSMVSKTIRIEAARRVVVTAIVLKRFQLKHSQWPQTLDELAPEFFPAVPVDPYDGKPLRYHPNADGNFLLYCVGEDGVDDGGTPIWPTGIINASSSFYWQNAHARDWVWPQPATDAEIKDFYEHPPK